MLRWTALAALAACSASVDGNNGADPDAAPQPDAAPTDAGPDARPCAGGDKAGLAPDGTCLQLFTTKKPFAEARLACEMIGSHLAIIRTQAVDTFAEAFVELNDTFIGLSDLTTETQFVWVDNSALTFDAWAPNEPNDGGGTYAEDCAVISGSRPAKLWDDRPCAPTLQLPNAGSYAYLCQF
jgi:hypothetical protein